MNAYVNAALAFARDALTPGQKRHGQRIVKAARRFLADIERAKSPDCAFDFSPEYAEHACRWIEQLPHVEGKWTLPVIRLEPFQSFALVQLFGFRKRTPLKDAYITLRGVRQAFRPRRYTAMLYCTGRKNAKSTIAAGVGLYIQCTEPEEGQQLYSAATTYQQAMPIFNTAKRMAEKSLTLRTRYGLQVWSKALKLPANGSLFAPLHAKASTQDGLNPSCAMIDEVHAHKSPDLINVLTSAAGARSAPFFGYWTTEGYTNGNGPWRDIRGFSDKILDGVFEADHMLVIFFSVDPDDEDFGESCWIKANPLLLTNPHLLSAIQKEAIEARGMPSKLAEFRIKRLNRESNPPHAWIKLDDWLKCDCSPVDLSDFAGLNVYAGLDLSSTTDICAFRLIAEHPERGLITWGRQWVPSEAVRLRTERGTVPYAAWVAAGLIEEIDGQVIDQRVVKAAILDTVEILGTHGAALDCLAIDPWNGKQIAGELMEEGINVLEFIQGTKSYHPVMQAFEARYLSHTFAPGSDPVLRWCASNLVTRRDVNLNMAPDRRKAPEKIDVMVALLIAYGAMLANLNDGGFAASLGDPICG